MQLWFAFLKMGPTDGNLLISNDTCQQIPLTKLYHKYTEKSPDIANKPGTAKVGAISKAQNLKGGPFGLCETPAGCKNFLKN